MFDKITIQQQSPAAMYIQLKDPSMLDPSVFGRMEQDASTLSCMVSDEKNGVLMYSTRSLLRLSDFLKACVFEQDQVYGFLIPLLEKAVAANRSKPLLLDVDCIYVSAFGDEIYFPAVPLALEYWLFQKEETIRFLNQLLEHLQCRSHFEVAGYIALSLHDPEFSLSNLVCGLYDLYEHVTPRKWYRRRRPFQPFRAKQAISLPAYERPFLPETGGQPFYVQQDAAQVVLEEQPQEFKEEEQLMTQVLELPEQAAAWLEAGSRRFVLDQPQMHVGRSSECEIVLSSPDISARHALISCSSGRYYLQDLHSTNHTLLNGRQVIRKMRLKEGMEIQFANVKAVFHE